jgi:PKD repeat protein
MYRLHNNGQPRQMTGSAMDLGAFEFTAGSTAQSVLAADFAAGATSVAAGQSIQFTDLSTGSPASWSWDFGDGSTVSNEHHPLHIYQNAGTYTVSLTVANTGGSDTETKSNYITVE